MGVSSWSALLILVFGHFAEKGVGEHQQSFSPCYEEWKVCAWIEPNPEVLAAGQGQAGHHRQQHPSTKVRLRSRTPPEPPVLVMDGF